MAISAVLSVTMILFSVIDIIGSLPIILDLKKRGVQIQPTTATITAGILMVAFLFFGVAILKVFGSSELVGLLERLNEEEPIRSITLAGLCTDICVISNALLIKAYFPEIPIAVDATCCAGVTVESHQRALDAMRVCQIDIVE